MTVSTPTIDPYLAQTLKEQVKQQLISALQVRVAVGETWLGLAYRLDPMLKDPHDARAFAAYLKHLNGNTCLPPAGQLIATRASQQVDALVSAHINSFAPQRPLASF